MLTNTTHSPFAKATPLNWNQVKWTDGFWADIDEVAYQHLVPKIRELFESKDVSHVVENFRVCAGDSDGTFGGTDFGDGDFYKWMEAAMYTAAKHDDQGLFTVIDNYIDLIKRCQLADGYISTKQIIGERQANGIQRFGDINDFEVYNFGHLFTTASLYYRLTGKTNFLAIAEKAAGYLTRMYRENAAKGNVQTAVCPSHYMGLVELYRTTGKSEYLDTADLAIRLRDQVKSGTADNQDRLPLHEQMKIEGHAVRANYLYGGVADLYLESGNPQDLDVLHRMWQNLIQQKLYITGGCGAVYNGAAPYGNFWHDSKTHQAYGYEYQLPNVTAYNETCAGIGNVLWAYRMFQIEPEATYFDIIERTMLNVNLAAMDLNGEKYFYENMLRRTKDLPYELIWPLTRKEYISSFCCPPNLARTLAETSEYAYLTGDHKVYVGLYGSNEATITLDDQTHFTLKQETAYPYSGTINFDISEISASQPFELMLRIPSWLQSGKITVANKTQRIDASSHGYYGVQITPNQQSLTINLTLDMPVRFTVAHPYVEEDTNQTAVERGPLVYCLEGQDCQLSSIDDCFINPEMNFTTEMMTIANKHVLGLKGTVNYRPQVQGEQLLYQPLNREPLQETAVRLIPYFAWDNRGVDEMRIWMPLVNQIAGVKA